MNTKEQITRFSQAGRGQLNASERLRAGMWALLAFGGLALLSELPFVLCGHRVARAILLLPLVLSLAVAAGCYLRFRYSHHKAVDHIDRFFDLKEGLVTADEHIREGRTEEIHALQLRHTERALQPHDPVRLRAPFPRRLLMLSFLLLAVAVALLWVDDSPAVKMAKLEKVEMLALSKKVKDQLKQALEDMQAQTNQNVAALLKDPSLKKMIDQFEANGDRKTVMRKLSEIDRRLARMQSKLDTRADEDYLKALADQLRQSRDTAALGNALSKSNYKKASRELDKMQLGGPNADQDQRKALEKLAAHIGETEKSMSSNSSGSRRSAQEMSRRIQNMAQEQKRNGHSSSNSQNTVNQSISQNSRSMQQLAARKQAESALGRMRRQLQQEQNRMAMNGRSPGMSQMPGGNQPGGDQAGNGVDRVRRPLGMKSPADGRLDHLSGQLGEGETEKSIEDASTGTGVASRDGVRKALDNYKQQMEAFVRREDIPEEMKYGVKSYFEQVHQLEQQAGNGGE